MEPVAPDRCGPVVLREHARGRQAHGEDLALLQLELLARSRG